MTIFTLFETIFQDQVRRYFKLSTKFECVLSTIHFHTNLCILVYNLPDEKLIITPVGQSILVEDPIKPFKSFTVTALDAHHCPGSVMFYFEGDFGNILYTGDFRACNDLIKECEYLQGKVDILYYDNTFASPGCVFPSRDKCKEIIIDIVKSHSDHDILFATRKLGKEDLLADVGTAVNESIFVSPKMLGVCNKLFDSQSNVFTTETLEGKPGRLRTEQMNLVTRKKINELNRKKKTIAIIPTALYTGR